MCFANQRAQSLRPTETSHPSNRKFHVPILVPMPAGDVLPGEGDHGICCLLNNFPRCVSRNDVDGSHGGLYSFPLKKAAPNCCWKVHSIAGNALVP
jgi:hypothetical protein